MEISAENKAKLLIHMMEESGEVTKACGKWLRYGKDSFHPSDSERTTNNILLAREIGNLLAISILLSEDIPENEIQAGIKSKMQILKQDKII